MKIFRYTYISNSEEDTERLGAILASVIKPGVVLALAGDLAAGKTTLTRFICHALDINEWYGSPSFTIINEYSGRFPLYHIDFFRLSDEDEVFALGIEKYITEECAAIVEWPELIEEFLPPDTTVKVKIQVDDDGNSRTFYLSGPFAIPGLEHNMLKENSHEKR